MSNAIFPDVHSYAEAARYLQNRSHRSAGYETTIERTAEGIAVRYFDTRIVTYHPDGGIVLATGGYKTLTTKERLNAFGPYSVSIYSERRKWYAWNRETNEKLEFAALDGTVKLYSPAREDGTWQEPLF